MSQASSGFEFNYFWYTLSSFHSENDLRNSASNEHVVFRRRPVLTLKMLVTTIDAQWEGMGDVGSARYEMALVPPCPTIRVLSYSN